MLITWLSPKIAIITAPSFPTTGSHQLRLPPMSDPEVKKEDKDSSLESNAFNPGVLEKGGGQRSQWTCRDLTFSLYRCTHICAHTHTTPVFLSRLTAARLTSIPCRVKALSWCLHRTHVSELTEHCFLNRAASDCITVLAADSRDSTSSLGCSESVTKCTLSGLRRHTEHRRANGVFVVWFSLPFCLSQIKFS